MRGFKGFRDHLASAALAATLGAALVACGSDQCNHVITDVPTFEDCQAIAVQRGCSDQITYSRANSTSGKPSRCKVERCSDCNGPIPTPSATPEG